MIDSKFYVEVADRIIEMAWEDRTPFDAIKLQGSTAILTLPNRPQPVIRVIFFKTFGLHD